MRKGKQMLSLLSFGPILSITDSSCSEVVLFVVASFVNMRLFNSAFADLESVGEKMRTLCGNSGKAACLA